ncbi:hypothetical protein HK104_001410 [Borealophlyctis nickersoniae]|nr:hypothetical protein HK104_001410 [Borealophlyctis nickersoniae]
MTRRTSKQPKTPKTRRGAAAHSDESDDDRRSFSSDVSHTTADSFLSVGSRRSVASSRGGGDEPEVVETLEDQVVLTIDELTEKRSSTREEALRRLVKFLSHKYIPDVMETHMETLVHKLVKIIRRETLEGILAARVLALCWITHGANEDIYDEVETALRDAIKSGRSELRIPCIDALGAVAFMEGVEDYTAWEIMTVLQKHLSVSGGSSGVIKSALNAYGLLYSQFPPRVDHDAFNKLVDTHVKLLGADDIDVRVAAGENLALIFGDGDDTHMYEGRDNLLDVLGSLAEENDKHRQRKDRVIQRSAFRDILHTVEDGISPQIKLKFKHETLTLDSWPKIIQLNAMRHALGDGLSVHFLENPGVQQIFGLSFDRPAPTMTSTDRRLRETATGKARAKALNGPRGKRNVVMFDDYAY